MRALRDLSGCLCASLENERHYPSPVAHLVARQVYQGIDKPERYDTNLVVIGAGSAGLVSAYIAAAVKAKVSLIEKHRMGGDCLNTGCVPSKALLRSAKLVAEVRNAQQLGFDEGQLKFDFGGRFVRPSRLR